EKVRDINYKFPSCEPQLEIIPGFPLPPDPNQPAVCVPKFITDFKGGTAALLTQSNCATGYICAPCKDPTTGASTGACD
ncbi:MAG: hypothetical protein FJ104_06640, partial [Deltaproteobacteria bacterium]|nr:hypothetical protein [Deltaproteobacteria bacterium]